MLHGLLTSLPQAHTEKWDFPKIRGTLQGAPIIRIIALSHLRVNVEVLLFSETTKLSLELGNLQNMSYACSRNLDDLAAFPHARSRAGRSKSQRRSWNELKQVFIENGSVGMVSFTRHHHLSVASCPLFSQRKPTSKESKLCTPSPQHCT